MASLSLAAALQRLQSMYSKGVQSKDSRLSDRHIYSALKTARSVVLRQQSNKNQVINEWNYQVLPCVKLIGAPKHECNCAPNGCLVLRGETKIPKVISDMSGHLLYITTVDGGIGFDPTTFDSVKYMAGNKFTTLKPRYYIRNSYPYLVSIKNLENVAIKGLFSDPVAAYTYPSSCPCTDCDCKDIMEMEFPIDEDLADSMFSVAEKELVLIMKQIKEDRNNDAADDETVVGLIHQPK